MYLVGIAVKTGTIQRGAANQFDFYNKKNSSMLGMKEPEAKGRKGKGNGSNAVPVGSKDTPGTSWAGVVQNGNTKQAGQYTQAPIVTAGTTVVAQVDQQKSFPQQVMQVAEQQM